jgi:NTE family protein
MNKLEELEIKFPGVRSKVLIDLINGIHVKKDIIKYGNKSGFFANLIDKLAGNNKKRQQLINGNLVEGQDALYQWVLDLSKDHTFSHVALQITQQKLLNIQEALVNTRIEVGGLRETLNKLVDFVEKQMHAEFKAHEKFEDIVRSWRAGRTYSSLPWAVQVALLAQEVFSSDVIYQLEEDKRKPYIQRLIDEIIANSKQLPESFFALSNLLELSLADLSSEDRAVANWLLEIDPLQDTRLVNKPHLFVIGKALKFAMLQQGQVNPAQEAIAICRKFAFISSATDKREFVKAVVQETADDCLAIIKGKPADFAVTLDSDSSDTLSHSPLVFSPQPSDTPFQLPFPSLPELLQQEHPKFGLVLAGGGAKGAYQVGVLKYLSEELKFVPHVIAGTSIGALNGAFLASHQPFDEAVKNLEKIWDKINDDIKRYKLNFGLADGLSIFDPKPIEKLLRDNVKPEVLRRGIELYVTVFPSFQPAIPLLDYLRGFLDSLGKENCTKAEWHCVSNSEFNDDTLYNLILASAAIPVAFPRRNINGQPYVDGFLGDNIPLRALEKKCDFAIVIHLDNGETWSRHKFPAQTIIEIRPQLPINESWISALNFDPNRIQELKKRGQEDARRYLEPIITTLTAEYWRTRTLRSLLSSTNNLISTKKIS